MRHAGTHGVGAQMHIFLLLGIGLAMGLNGIFASWGWARLEAHLEHLSPEVRHEILSHLPLGDADIFT